MFKSHTLNSSQVVDIDQLWLCHLYKMKVFFSAHSDCTQPACYPSTKPIISSKGCQRKEKLIWFAQHEGFQWQQMAQLIFSVMPLLLVTRCPLESHNVVHRRVILCLYFTNDWGDAGVLERGKKINLTIFICYVRTWSPAEWQWRGIPQYTLHCE